MAEATLSLDLHVLSPPLTFALSQDQTLHVKNLNLMLGVTLAGLPRISVLTYPSSHPSPRLAPWFGAAGFAVAPPEGRCAAQTQRSLFRYSVFRDRVVGGVRVGCRRGMRLIQNDPERVNIDRDFFYALRFRLVAP